MIKSSVCGYVCGWKAAGHKLIEQKIKYSFEIILRWWKIVCRHFRKNVISPITFSNFIEFDIPQFRRT